MRYKDYKYDVNIYFLIEQQIQYLIDILEDIKPKRICELGIGNTTQIFKRYKELYKDNIEICSIDDNNIIKLKHLENLKDNVIILPIIENTNITLNNKLYNNCNVYEGLEDWLKTQDKFDFIFIDGPELIGFNSLNNYDYLRIQLLLFVILDKISDNCIIMYHDSIYGKNTLKEFELLLDKFNFTFEKTIQYENIVKEMTIYKINKK